jgi:uncharacterized Fe-S center protein
LRDAPVFYGGPRATKEGYEQVIAEKGFTKLTTCEICDEYDTMPLHDGETAEVATILTNAKNLLVLTHVKGHPAAGFGATIKNIGIGAMSPKTKGLVHEMTSPTDERGFNQDRLGEVVAVAHQKMPANQLFVNIIRDVTKFCDCASEPGEIIASDIGTLISENLVAIDQASLDLLNQQAGRNLFAEENGIDPQPSIDACAKYSGLTKEYELVK